jgi:hypothetical protein
MAKEKVNEKIYNKLEIKLLKIGYLHNNLAVLLVIKFY